MGLFFARKYVVVLFFQEHHIPHRIPGFYFLVPKMFMCPLTRQVGFIWHGLHQEAPQDRDPVLVAPVLEWGHLLDMTSMVVRVYAPVALPCCCVL